MAGNVENVENELHHHVLITIIIMCASGHVGHLNKLQFEPAQALPFICLFVLHPSLFSQKGDVFVIEGALELQSDSITGKTVNGLNVDYNKMSLASAGSSY